MMKRKCDVQTNEYVQHIEVQHMEVQPPRTHNHGKYDNNGKGIYFRFDDDTKVSYKYIL